MDKKVILGIIFIILAVITVSGCLGEDKYSIYKTSLDDGTIYWKYTVKDTGNQYTIYSWDVNYDDAVNSLKLNFTNVTNVYGVNAIEYMNNNHYCVYFQKGSGAGMLIDLNNTNNTKEKKDVIEHHIKNNQ